MGAQRTNGLLFSPAGTFLPREALCVFVVMSSLTQHTLRAEKESVQVVCYEIPVSGGASGHSLCLKINIIPALQVCAQKTDLPNALIGVFPWL